MTASGLRREAIVVTVVIVCPATFYSEFRDEQPGIVSPVPTKSVAR